MWKLYHVYIGSHLLLDSTRKSKRGEFSSRRSRGKETGYQPSRIPKLDTGMLKYHGYLVIQTTRNSRYTTQTLYLEPDAHRLRSVRSRVDDSEKTLKILSPSLRTRSVHRCDIILCLISKIPMAGEAIHQTTHLWSIKRQMGLIMELKLQKHYAKRLRSV